MRINNLPGSSLCFLPSQVPAFHRENLSARLSRQLSLALLLCLVLLQTLPVSAHGPVALIGSGRPDFYPNSWSEGIFRWLIAQAPSSRFLIISTVDETGEIPVYFRQVLAHDLVATLTINERYVADDPAVAARIDAAGGVVVLDRDPGQILSLWKNTRTEAALQRAFAGGKALAGLGGGAQALIGMIPDATTRALLPSQVVRQPVAATMTCQIGLAGSVGEVFIDPFFTRRGRLPNLVNVMARRQLQVPTARILGIGIDEQTGLLWSVDDHLTVRGAGAVSFLRFTPATQIRLDVRIPPVVTSVALDQLTDGFMFNLSTGEVVLVPETAQTGFSAAALNISSDLLLDGGKTTSPQPGVWEVTELDRHSYALQRGLLGEIFGESRFDGLRLITGAFIEPDFYENRVGGMSWTLANHPGSWGILMDRGGKADLTASGRLVPLPLSGQPALLVFDATRMAHRDYSRWKTHLDAKGPRQSVGLTNVLLHLLATRTELDLRTGVVTLRP